MRLRPIEARSVEAELVTRMDTSEVVHGGSNFGTKRPDQEVVECVGPHVVAKV